eukprot:2775094-Pyramimonas_sp.AAC.1
MGRASLKYLDGSLWSVISADEYSAILLVMDFVFWTALEVQMSLIALRHCNGSIISARLQSIYTPALSLLLALGLNTDSYSIILEMVLFLLVLLALQMGYRTVQHINGKQIIRGTSETYLDA